VARELTACGIATKRGGHKWGHSTIYSMVTNEAYVGTAHFCKERSVEPARRRDTRAYRRVLKSSQRRRPREEWIPVPVPAILDRAVFDRAQARLQENGRCAPRNNKRNFYLLRGLLRCAACGYSVSGQANHGNLYYECRGQKPQDLKLTERCRARTVRVDRIEPVVWNTVKRLLCDPQLILGQAEQEAEARRVAVPNPQARKATGRRLTQLAAEEMRVVRLFREEKISEKVLDAQLQEIGRERRQREEDLAATEAAAAAGSELQGREELVWQFCADVREGLEHATPEEKQKVLRLVVDRIEVEPDGDQGTLHGTIPLSSANTGLPPLCQPRVEPRAAGREPVANAPIRTRAPKGRQNRRVCAPNLPPRQGFGMVCGPKPRVPRGSTGGRRVRMG
jgi:site-specific DNA recombinase